LAYPLDRLISAKGRIDSMKRFAIALGIAGAMLLPGSAFAFHHTGLPSTFCAAEAAGSPSNDNGQVKEALLANFARTGGITPALPLPPVGTPGNGQGNGGEECANTTEE
jgi:hypothetical protein